LMRLGEEESEILGIMFGDGSIYRTKRKLKVEITGHKMDDREYMLNHVAPLFLRVYGVRMRVSYRRDSNTMRLYTYSQEVAMRLHMLGMPIGPKSRATLLPHADVEPESFIRGLFDTDGCVYRKYGCYAQVQFKSIARELMEFVRNTLILMGFHSSRIILDETRYKFYLCRQEEVRRFFEFIRPANPKHLKRLAGIWSRKPTGTA